MQKHIGLCACLAIQFPWSGLSPAQQTLALGTITGRVLEEDGRRAVQFSYIWVEETRTGTTAREGGRFTLPVPVGTYTLRATFVGHRPGVETGIRVGAGRITNVEFRLEKETQAFRSNRPSHFAGSIRGKVLDGESKRPLDFANVVLLGTNLGGMTRAGGRFQVPEVPAGIYRVRATFVGYDPQTVLDVRVEPGKSTHLEFALRKGSCIASPIQVRGHAERAPAGPLETPDAGDRRPARAIPDDIVREAFRTQMSRCGAELPRRDRGSSLAPPLLPVEDPLGGRGVDLLPGYEEDLGRDPDPGEPFWLELLLERQRTGSGALGSRSSLQHAAALSVDCEK